ncbi:MAG: type II toxin-antitoxin system VapC family toxin [Acidobacteria bacterium]|nr:type II toxin-antitoxin system VapC family toxin [Acidobacteriota bacterium]
MAILVDTNVLVRYADRHDPRHPIARQAVDALRSRDSLRTASQNLVELWNVLTRPRLQNGFGKRPEEAGSILRTLEDLFPRMADSDDAFGHWKRLVERFQVSGVQVHDARLVAAMLCHDISTILTFDGRDFRRYSELGIQALDPREV